LEIKKVSINSSTTAIILGLKNALNNWRRKRGNCPGLWWHHWFGLAELF